MRNLVLLGERHRRVAVEHDVEDAIVSQIVDDLLIDLAFIPSMSSESETTTIILTQNGLLLRSKTEESGDLQSLSWTSCDLNQVCQRPTSQWFQLTYVDPYLVALSKNGAIVTVDPLTGQAELVGEFDYGIEAGVWSPDRELLLLVTFADADDNDDDNNQIKSQEKKSVLLTMNSQWEVLSEINFEPHIPSNGELTMNTDTKIETVSIAWRPDGTLCAVSSVDVADQARKIRIYERDGLQLHALGRAEDGGGKLVPNLVGDAGLAWASAGCSHLLTAVQRKGTSSQQVVFFEPNGLRHREFTIRDGTSSEVLGLTWNTSSDLLAVWLRESNEGGIDKVQLWHRSNYHWYLKQEFRYAPIEKVTCCMFHNDSSHVLYVGLSQNLQWREYEVRWDPSNVLTTHDTCTAAVIDGNVLNLTPFEKAVVPPSMYAASLPFDFPIRQVCFANGGSMVTIVVQLTNGGMVLLGGEGNRSDLVPIFMAPRVIASVVWDNRNGIDLSLLRSLQIMNVESASNLRLAAIYPPKSDQPNDSLVEISVLIDEKGQANASLTNVAVLEGRVSRMVPWSDGAPGALVQLNDGQLLECEFSSSGSLIIIPSTAEPLIEPCPWMAAIHDTSRFSDGNQSHKERLVVGMTERFRLYCHDRLLCDSVSSFILSPKHRFLSYATSGSRCQLVFLPIADLLTFDPLMGLDENNLLEGFEPRHIERGARLVALVSSHPTAILQMPRGNLEGTYPRALVLPFVISSIIHGAYNEAFNMMRRQKVDLNLIVDVDPVHFLSEGASRLVEQVKPIDHLNLFISYLHNWDSTRTKYSVASWLQRRNDDEADCFDFASKTNLVCCKLRSIMLEAEASGHTQGGRAVSDGHFLLPVLSTFAKEDPPKLNEALTLIKDNAISKHPATSRKLPLFSERAQSSIQYLAFLANYELLFETALGMYDFELARSIARNSQMDPKVYLPLIQSFKALPEYFARFQVDLRLKRYEAALSNLFESGEREENVEQILRDAADPGASVSNDFESCLNFIEGHGLHKIGLRLFEKYPEKRRKIMLSLGSYLLEQNQGEVALTVYLAAKPPDYEGAKRAARLAGDWRFLFSLVGEHSEGHESVSTIDKQSLVAHDIANEIADSATGSQLRRQGLASAARVLLDYGKDVGAAVDMLVNAEMWDEGLRVARFHAREDLARRCVEAAVTYGRTLLTDFEERSHSFLTANMRYDEVLKIRKAAVSDEHYGEGGELAGDDSGSFYSAASNASVDSLRSTASSTSTGSVSSVSSIISVKSSNTFAFKGENSNRHKSKFNKAGGEKKKVAKKKAHKRKMQPGSEEELKSVVDTLKSSFVDAEYCSVIVSTVSFLCHVEMIELAGEIYRNYCAMKKTINDTQLERIESSMQERIMEERQARKDGAAIRSVTLPIETEVDSLSCPELPQSLHNLFEYLN